MAITIPASLGLVALEDMIAGKAAGVQPIKTILLNSNFHYARHSPCAVAFAPIQAGLSASEQFVVPVIPSADALDYSVEVATFDDVTGAGESVTLVIETDNTSSSPGGWTGLFSQAIAHATANVWSTHTMALAAAVRFLRVTVTATTGNPQLQWIGIYPKTMTSIAAGTKASGFKPINDAHIDGAGAGIHAEYWNRVKRNAAAVLRDRRQVVFSHVDRVSGGYRKSVVGGRTNPLVAFGALSLPFQTSPTITVRCRANDAGSGLVRVSVDGGEAVSFVADDTDRSETLLLPGPHPIIRVTTEPDSGTDVRYVTADWRPGD